MGKFLFGEVGLEYGANAVITNGRVSLICVHCISLKFGFYFDFFRFHLHDFWSVGVL